MSAGANQELDTGVVHDMSAETLSNRESTFPRLNEVPHEHRIIDTEKCARPLINGELTEWKGPSEPVFSPIPIETDLGPEQIQIGKQPLMSAEQSLEALNAAEVAFGNGLGTWPQMSTAARIEHVETFIEKLSEKREQIVKLLMWEIGKTLPDAEKEFDRTVEYMQDTLAELQAMQAEAGELFIKDGIQAQIGRGPKGVVLCMGPFNYPLNETFTTLIPALVMGNTAVFKTPRMGTLLFDPVNEAFKEAFPAGVVNTIYGDGKEVITPIMSSGKVDVLAFIGSTQVADIITKQHPNPHRLSLVLGLGAKNPAIVLPDADLDKAVPEIVKGALSYNGQRCTALKAIFVHESIADQFAERLSSAVGELKAGMPWESGVKITPLAEPNKHEFLSELVEDAVARGAKVINPGGGTYQESLYRPAVLYPVSPDARVINEEQFGPVVPVATFSDSAEVVDYVANSPFAQQAAIFGQNSEKVGRIVSELIRLDARVNINTQCQRGPDELPFTGKKSSAAGTLSIRDALEIFSVPAVLAGKQGDPVFSQVAGRAAVNGNMI